LPGDDHIEFRDLTIAFPTGGASGSSPQDLTTLSIARIEMTGLSQTAVGYRVRSLQASDVKLGGSAGNATLSSIKLEGFDLPTRDWPAAAAATPTASLVALFRAFGRVSLQHGAAADFKLTPPGLGVIAMAVDRLEVDGISQGRLDRASASRVQVNTGPDSGFDLSDVVAESVDTASLARVFDTATYRPVPPETLWTQVIARVALGAATQTSPTGAIKLSGASVEGLHIRPFRSDVPAKMDSMAQVPTDLQNNSAEARALFSELTDILRLDRLSLNALSLRNSAAPFREVSCGSIAVDGASLRAIEAATASQCALDLRDGPAFDVAEVSLKGLSGERLIASLSIDPTTADVAPTLDHIKLSGLVAKNAPHIRLGEVSLDMAAPIRGVPTRGSLSVSQFEMPAAEMGNPLLRGALQDLSLQVLAADISARFAWHDAAEDLDIEEIALKVAQVGRLSLSATIGAVPRKVFGDSATANSTIETATLRRIRLGFDNDTLAERVLAKLAEANKTSQEEMRKGLSRALPNILAGIPDATSRARLTFALLSFLNAPGFIEISSTILQPVPLSKVAETLRTVPASVPGLLKLDATAGKTRLAKP
jgi:hypothetical protein